VSRIRDFPRSRQTEVHSPCHAFFSPSTELSAVHIFECDCSRHGRFEQSFGANMFCSGLSESSCRLLFLSIFLIDLQLRKCNSLTHIFPDFVKSEQLVNHSLSQHERLFSPPYRLRGTKKFSAITYHTSLHRNIPPTWWKQQYSRKYCIFQGHRHEHFRIHITWHMENLKKKGRLVPVHAIKACGGEWRYNTAYSLSWH
jgi:hypothetical protein